MTTEDNILWEDLKKTVHPFHSGKKSAGLPPRLCVQYAQVKPLEYSLDLHQLTIQAAYQKTLQFIEKHYKIGSKKVQIITGKGQEGQGIIRNEFEGWLDTKNFQQYIRSAKWTNDGGAINLWLRKNK